MALASTLQQGYLPTPIQLSSSPVARKRVIAGAFKLKVRIL